MVDVMSELMWSRVSGVLVLSFLVLMMLMLMSIVLIKSYLFYFFFPSCIARPRSFIHFFMSLQMAAGIPHEVLYLHFPSLSLSQFGLDWAT